MAMQTMPVADNGAMSLIANLFSQGNSLFGSGKQTTTETTSSDAGAMGNSNALLQQLMSGNISGDIDTMIEDLFKKASQAFGPSVMSSIAQGNRAYTDTTLADLQNRGRAAAVAEAAKAKLAAINANNAIAAQIVNGQLANAPKTRTVTQQTAASPMGKATQALGLAATGYSLYDKYKKTALKDTKGIDSIIDNIMGGGVASGGNGFSAGVNETFAAPTNVAMSQDFGFNPLADQNAAIMQDILGPQAFSAASSVGSEASTLSPSGTPNSNINLSGAGALGGAVLNEGVQTFPYIDNSVRPDQIQELAPVDTITTPTSDAGGGGGIDVTSENFLDSATADLGGGIISDVGSNFGSAIGDLNPDLIDFGSDLAGDGLNLIEGAASGSLGDLLPYAGSILDLAEGDVGGAVGSAIGTYILPGIGTFIGGQIGENAEEIVNGAGEIIGTIGDGVGDVAEEVVNVFEDLWDGFTDFFDTYICTELVRQNKLSQFERAKMHAIFHKNFSIHTIEGYHIWAIHFAKAMKKSPLLTKLGKRMVISWRDISLGKPSPMGIFMHYIVRPPTFLLGYVANFLKKDKLSWQN